MMGSFGLSGMWLGGLLMLVFWLFVLGGIVWLVLTLAKSQSASNTSAAGQTPLELLRVRYARGEITKEQFDQMRRDLGA